MKIYVKNSNFVVWEKIISKIISLLSKEREEDISNGNPRGEGISLPQTRKGESSFQTVCT